jgi:RNA-directed DNA polymerase
MGSGRGGMRTRRSSEIRGHLRAGYQAVYDADLKGYFDSIPHGNLLACVRQRVTDRSVLALIRIWLEAPMEERAGGSGKWSRNERGTPQGEVISPLLANLYLHWFDALFHGPHGPARWADAKLVRYADDMAMLARRWTAELSAYVESKLEGKFGLEINRDKTRVVDERRESLDFLGYTFRYDRDLQGRRKKYLNVLPSKQAVGRERAKLREPISVGQSHTPLPQLVERLNRGLEGSREILQLRLPAQGVVGDRLVRTRPPEASLTTAQSKTVPSTAGRELV